jgi:hypothetical protein
MFQSHLGSITTERENQELHAEIVSIPSWFDYNGQLWMLTFARNWPQFQSHLGSITTIHLSGSRILNADAFQSHLGSITTSIWAA